MKCKLRWGKVLELKPYSGMARPESARIVKVLTVVLN